MTPQATLLVVDDNELNRDVLSRHLQRQGYRVWTQTIPADITPKNRLLLGAPAR